MQHWPTPPAPACRPPPPECRRTSSSMPKIQQQLIPRKLPTWKSGEQTNVASPCKEMQDFPPVEDQGLSALQTFNVQARQGSCQTLPFFRPIYAHFTKPMRSAQQVQESARESSLQPLNQGKKPNEDNPAKDQLPQKPALLYLLTPIPCFRLLGN